MAWGRNKSRPSDLTGRWAGRVLGVRRAHRGSLFRDAGATGLAPLTHGLSSSCQLLSAASLFQLDALQRHCEILCSQTLSVDSAVNTYKYAKVRAPAATPAPHHSPCCALAALKDSVTLSVA